MFSFFSLFLAAVSLVYRRLDYDWKALLISFPFALLGIYNAIILEKKDT